MDGTEGTCTQHSLSIQFKIGIMKRNISCTTVYLHVYNLFTNCTGNIHVHLYLHLYMYIYTCTFTSTLVHVPWVCGVTLPFVCFFLSSLSLIQNMYTRVSHIVQLIYNVHVHNLFTYCTVNIHVHVHNLFTYCIGTCTCTQHSILCSLCVQ